MTTEQEYLLGKLHRVDGSIQEFLEKVPIGISPKSHAETLIGYYKTSSIPRLEIFSVQVNQKLADRNPQVDETDKV